MSCQVKTNWFLAPTMHSDDKKRCFQRHPRLLYEKVTERCNMLINYEFCFSHGQLDISPNLCVKDLHFAVLNNGFQCDPGQAVHDSAFYVICNGKRLDKSCILEDGKTYHLVPRVLGGKGGFGSMLRAIGAQIEKTTSREACRDLSGRRMRDINNEKKLKEWLAKEAEREQEREEKKKDRLARHLRPQHKFDDTEYHEQKAKVQEDLQEALNAGLKRKMKNGEGSALSQHKKSKPEEKTSKTEWLGVDLDSDLDSSDSDMEANPGDSQQERSDSASPDRFLSPSSSRCVEKTDLKEDTKHMIHGEGTRDESISNLTKSSSADFGEATPKEENSAATATASIPSDTPIDLEQFSSSLELQALGLDRLKHALISRGLKCGGTLEERADRLMIVSGLSAEEVQASHPGLLAKGTGSGKGGRGKKSK